MDIVNIDISMIEPDRSQPRKFFDEKSIDELSESIKKHGIIQPILVFENGDNHFTIIAGERRFRAAKKAGINVVPCIVRGKVDSMEISLIENVQRENLNPIEEANAIKRLIEEKNYTHEEVSSVISKSRAYVTNKLRLLDLDDFTKDNLNSGFLSQGHGKALLGVSDDVKRKSLVKKILDNKLSVRETEKIIRKSKNSIIDDDEIEQVKEILEDKLETKVEINQSSQKGQLIVDFYSYDQLKEIIDKILNIC